MVTKKLLGLALLLPLMTSGCGGGEEAEAKQAALEPAATAAAAPDTPAAGQETAAPAATAAAVEAPAAATEKPAAPEGAAPAATDADAASSAATAPESETKTIGRESFSYTGGARDPFVSLLEGSRVGPELPDLSLVSISYDTRNPSNSVVVMREKIGNKRYTLRPGDRLGRMRVGSVRPKDVTFLIDDFGTQRQETVSLRKDEEETP
ncbi:MAG: hypothetical protein AB7S39_16895 [Gemmatimonadales bacterium]